MGERLHYLPAWLRTMHFVPTTPAATAPAAEVHDRIRDALKVFHDAVSVRPVEMTDDDWRAWVAHVDDMVALWSLLLGSTIMCSVKADAAVKP